MFQFFEPFDKALAEFTYITFTTNSFFSWLFYVLHLFGTLGLGFIMIGLMMLFFKKSRQLGITILVALLIGALLTNLTLKPLVTRIRPFLSQDPFYANMRLNSIQITETGYSFPSGHTTACTAFSTVLFIKLNKKYSFIFLLLPVLMAFSRVGLLVHYASDCLFGLLVGGISGTISYFLVKFLSNLINKKREVKAIE